MSDPSKTNPISQNLQQHDLVFGLKRDVIISCFTAGSCVVLMWHIQSDASSLPDDVEMKAGNKRLEQLLTPPPPPPLSVCHYTHSSVLISVLTGLL